MPKGCCGGANCSCKIETTGLLEATGSGQANDPFVLSVTGSGQAGTTRSC
jgi:hypothetical protein